MQITKMVAIVFLSYFFSTPLIAQAQIQDEDRSCRSFEYKNLAISAARSLWQKIDRLAFEKGNNESLQIANVVADNCDPYYIQKILGIAVPAHVPRPTCGAKILFKNEKAEKEFGFNAYLTGAYYSIPTSANETKVPICGEVIQ